jgi:hypothetical protein
LTGVPGTTALVTLSEGTTSGLTGSSLTTPTSKLISAIIVLFCECCNEIIQQVRI